MYFTLEYFLDLKIESPSTGRNSIIYDNNQTLREKEAIESLFGKANDTLEIKYEKMGELYKKMKLSEEEETTFPHEKKEFYVNEKFPLSNEEWLFKLKKMVFEQIILKRYTWTTITKLHGINQLKFRDRLIRVTGLSLIAFQKEMQFKLAARLLEDKKNLTIEEIAKLVGFRDRRYFTKEFKKYFKMTPRKFKNLCEN